MGIESVTRFVSPPPKPREVGGSEDWKAVEAQLGTPLPEDYRAFIVAFGTGTIDGFMMVFNPFSANRFVNLIERGRAELEAYVEVFQPPAGSPFLTGGARKTELPHPVYPSPGGLLPFAGTDNGEIFFWKTAGAPDQWTTVVYAARGPEYFEYPGGMTDLLGALLSRTTTCSVLPASFPSAKAAFVPV
jgi:hypothetical protein